MKPSKFNESAQEICLKALKQNKISKIHFAFELLHNSSEEELIWLLQSLIDQLEQEESIKKIKAYVELTEETL